MLHSPHPHNTHMQFSRQIFVFAIVSKLIVLNDTQEIINFRKENKYQYTIYAIRKNVEQKL